MSGVFGVIDPNGQLNIPSLIAGMQTSMSHRDWFVAEHFIDQTQNLAFGRIGINVFNRSKQPVWNTQSTIALVMAGEFYGKDSQLVSSSQQSDEKFALALYEEFGDEFVRHLNGAFILAIWDSRRNRILVANDRFGLYQLFYSCLAGRLVFAPEIKAILRDNSFPRKLDMVALAQYMRFQHLLGERTFFEDINLLPAASLLNYDLTTRACRISSYWTFDDIPHRPDIGFDEAAEESGRLLREAVQRLSGDSYRPGVYLSGGLDSRTILGLIEHRPVVSMTYGRQDCRDVYYAGKVAKAVESDHYWFDFPNGEWVKQYADFHLDLTEGFHSWIHAHGISTLPQARKLVDVVLTGWDGGTVMGHKDLIDPLQISAVDDTALIARLFYLFNQEFTWPSINEAEEHLLYCEPIRKKIQGLAFDSFCEEMSAYLDYRPDIRSELFYIDNHCRRLTHNMVVTARSHVEVRFPFFDYVLFDFIYSLPASLRGHQVLYRALIQKEIPRLALIPYDQDEFLPTSHSLIRGTHALYTKVKRRFNRHIWPIFRERHTLYADYEEYLRGELRDWAENILFDDGTLKRRIFDSAFLHTLFNRHMSGLEEWTIGKIAPILTYEMMLSRFYD